MSDYKTVAKVGEIPEGRGMRFEVGGRVVAIFNAGGTYHAIDDFCPHQMASLSAGAFENGIVACPWHDWQFDVRDGTWCNDRRLKIDCFEGRVGGYEIQVRVPDDSQPTVP